VRADWPGLARRLDRGVEDIHVGAREPGPGFGKKEMVNVPSDAAVIGLSMEEPEAFGVIYDRHAAGVLRFLGRRVGAEVAEGLLGELFRIAFERRKTFDASRASARMVAADQAPTRRAGAAALDARMLFPRVADAIQALPDGEREALLLVAWEDLSYQSVAEALELPIGTVRSRINRARVRLRELVEPAGKNRVRTR